MLIFEQICLYLISARLIAGRLYKTRITRLLYGTQCNLYTRTGHFITKIVRYNFVINIFALFMGSNGAIFLCNYFKTSSNKSEVFLLNTKIAYQNILIPMVFKIASNQNSTKV